jgi:periplasmic divalent cation tolerance protein
MEYIAVVTTLAGRDAALVLGRALVEQRLVACAQVSAIDSIYWWDGALQQEPEFRLLCKTTAALWPAVEAAILQRHPYDLPAIHASALVQVNAAYRDWITQNVLSSSKTGLP